MKNSLYEKISDILKSHPIISIIISIIGILPLIVAVTLYLWDGIVSLLEPYPLFGGAIFSWFFAVGATIIVLFIASISQDKKDQYKISEKSKRRLTFISIVVIFYISINLASEALTGAGVPILSEPHQIGSFINVTYQDVFLISLVFLTIILVFFVAPYTKSKLIFAFLLVILIIVLLFSPLFFFHQYEKDMPETYLFSWGNVPGDENKKLIIFLNESFGINWAENAKINKSSDCRIINISKDEKSAEITMDEKKEKAILKIRDGKTHELKVKTENGKLYIYPKTPQESILSFLYTIVVSFLLSILIYAKMPEDVKKKSKDDLRDLLLYFSIIPAFVVASLVLIEHKLVTFPNIAGHMVVGFLFISGFATLVILTSISLKDVRNGWWIWGFTVVASLAAISFFSAVFLIFEDHIYKIDTFRKILTFSIAIILVILQYGFAYEKLLKYRFTEWWRRVWRPITMIISIPVILIIGAIKSEYKIIDVPIKLLLIGIVLAFVISLPWIIIWVKKILKGTWFRMLLKRQIPKLRIKLSLPMHQGMVLVKVETDPSSLKKVVEGLDGMEGVYQTMVVKGEYDVCLTVEGVSPDDIAKKILKIRNIKGVASTTTLTDIREFFDREVR